MKFIKHLIVSYPVSCLYLACIWVLCFANIPSTPLDNVAFIDKWTHIVMYGGTCATIWMEYLRKHKKISKIKLFLFAWLAPIMMSGLIEILQATCTGGRRSGDWLDFAANSTGATIGALIGTLTVWYRARQKKAL